MQKAINYTIIALFAVYIFSLYQSGRLGFYIHPRYTAFTYVMALSAFVFCVVFLIRLFEKRAKAERVAGGGVAGSASVSGAWGYVGKARNKLRAVLPHRDLQWMGLLVLCVPLVFGFLLPVRPLSAATAEQRIIDLNALRRRDVSTADLFIRNTKSYSLGDWVAAFNANPDYKKYVGKQVDVSGFVFDPQRSDEYFMAARFVITCCAVDARPIGLYVQSDWRDKFAENKWVRVQGELELVQINGTETLAVVPASIEEVPTPNDPYVY